MRHAVLRKRVERSAHTAYATDLATGLPHQAQLIEHLTQLLAELENIWAGIPFESQWYADNELARHRAMLSAFAQWRELTRRQFTDGAARLTKHLEATGIWD